MKGSPLSIITDLWDFPGGLSVKTLHFHFRGHGSNPDWGTRIPYGPWLPHVAKKQNKKIIITCFFGKVYNAVVSKEILLHIPLQNGAYILLRLFGFRWKCIPHHILFSSFSYLRSRFWSETLKPYLFQWICKSSKLLAVYP